MQNELINLRYIRLANTIRQRITDGVHQPGERLPRQHDMAKEHGVAFGTLKKALVILGNEGYVVCKQGMGTYAALPRNHMPTALVVDDDEGVRRFMASALEDMGWRSVVVESGELALGQLKESRFDTIFLDLVMPGLNGAETFRRIREKDPAVRVVIITGYPDSAILMKALKSGPFVVMQKPLILEELRMVLSQVATGSDTTTSRLK